MSSLLTNGTCHSQPNFFMINVSTKIPVKCAFIMSMANPVSTRVMGMFSISITAQVSTQSWPYAARLAKQQFTFFPLTNRKRIKQRFINSNYNITIPYSQYCQSSSRFAWPWLETGIAWCGSSKSFCFRLGHWIVVLHRANKHFCSRSEAGKKWRVAHLPDKFDTTKDTWDHWSGCSTRQCQSCLDGISSSQW